MQIGFAGLGAMGAPLARTLLRAGKQVLLWNRSPEKAEALVRAGAGGTQATCLADFAACGVVFTCLALPEHVRTVAAGAAGLYAAMRPGSVHVECSTIAPDTARELAEAAAAKGIAYVQCTLGKTPAHAERGEAPLFIGGPAAVVEPLKDLFACMGAPNYVGSVEAACAVKLISNLVGMTNLAVLAEGLKLGDKAGLDRQTLLALLADTGARSFQMDVRGPWLAEEDFAPRFGLDLALKDVRLGCSMAAGWGMEPALMRGALELFTQASAGGHGKEDCAAVITAMR